MVYVTLLLPATCFGYPSHLQMARTDRAETRSRK